MSKIKLVIAILFLIILAMFGIWYFSKPKVNQSGVEEKKSFLSFWGDFNPFAGNKTQTSENGNPAVSEGGENPDNALPDAARKARFAKVSLLPISGYTVFQKERYIDLSKQASKPDSLEGELEGLDNLEANINSATDISSPNTELAPAIRYADKDSGNIMETFADEINEKRFSSTVVKGVHETFFGNNGNSLVMRYLRADEQTIVSFVGKLPKETLGQDQITANDLTGEFIQENTIGGAFSPDGSKLFYIAPYKDGVVGIVSASDASRKNQIFESPLTEWLVSWPTNNLIALNTKPSHSVDGYMFTLDANTKSFNKVLGKIKGLTTNMSSDGKYVLYGDGDLNLYVYDIAKKNSTKLSVRTLPEKCVWGSNNETIYCGVPKDSVSGEYPDVWYQGLESFDDDIWRIDAVGGAGSLILNPKDYTDGESIDIVNPMLDNEMKYLFFVNKKTDLLYRYKIYQ